MGFKHTNSEALLDKVKKGDKRALSDLYTIYADDLYNFGRLFTTDSSRIEDCIHDLFLELYVRRKKLPFIRNIKNYLFTILRRKINEQTNSKLLFISPEEAFKGKNHTKQEICHESAIIHQEEKEELALQLSNALIYLTPKQKTGVSMRFFENKSYKEIAVSLDISIETARTLVYRSIKRLQENFSR